MDLHHRGPARRRPLRRRPRGCRGARERHRRHVSLQQRCGRLPGRREPAVPPDLRPGEDRGRPGDAGRHGRAGRSFSGRRRLDAELRGAAGHGGRRHADPGRPVVRRPGRRLVLPRPAHLRPAVRRGPERGRRRHAQLLQRQLRRPAGADRRASRCAGRGRRRRPGDRCLVDHRAPEHEDPAPRGRGWRYVLRRRLRPGLTPREPAGQRGRRPGEPQGHVQRPRPVGRRGRAAGRQQGALPRGAQAPRGALRHRGQARAASGPVLHLPDRAGDGGRHQPQPAGSLQRRRPSVGTPSRDPAAEHVDRAF